MFSHGEILKLFQLLESKVEVIMFQAEYITFDFPDENYYVSLQV